MVTERAELTIAEGQETDFEAAAAQALPLIEAADGAGTVTLLHGIETPTIYMLLVEWGSVDEHIAFTKTDAFAQFGSLVKPFFAGAPAVAHFQAP